MADQLSLRGGTTSEHATFTGANKEVTVDTTKKTLVVNDGATVGGHPLMRENASNSALALGSAGTPSLKFTGDTNTGIYSPGADQLAISTNGTGRLFVDASGRVGVGTGSPSSNGLVTIAETTNARLYLTDSTLGNTYGAQLRGYGVGGAGGFAELGVVDNNVYSKAITVTEEANAIIFSRGATERMRLDSSGRLGLGTSDPGTRLDVRYSDSTTTLASLTQIPNGIRVFNTDTTANNFALVTFAGSVAGTAGAAIGLKNTSNAGSTSLLGRLFFATKKSGESTLTEAMCIDESQRVGIGTISPGENLSISSTAAAAVVLGINGPSGQVSRLQFKRANSNRFKIECDTSDNLLFYSDASTAERARIDSSGRLLVGTSTARNLGGVEIEGTTFENSSLSITRNTNGTGDGGINLNKSRGSSAGSVTALLDNDRIGAIIFRGADGSSLVPAAQIQALVDGTPGASDMPGRLVFSTTSDGAASTTERMRIDNAGGVFINRTTGAIITSAERLTVVGAGTFQRASGTPLHVNRTTDDGNLLEFYQDTAIEGSISVSGNTVSLNGAHLSRWSQLPGNGDRVEILRGTVLSNLDEMCDWGEQTNEQLNRMKVSDVEGDFNVAGVFQGWDNDDEVHTKDFYCAMTGDMIIRIAEGVTVQRGDLLMSAGDGTAKPQDDDIIRSKTVAKVTSTNVSCTYDDGSYCVPCVLMAC